ncbi:MAG: glycosyltransferase family 2 protein [Candidatus Hydrogenedentes bacterium]|nr:glycosyltransferase family 2 protein [Candidatus Hydrogenedentota bacterium]
MTDELGKAGSGEALTQPVTVSFVVIGYNEAQHLEACLESVRTARLGGEAFELIYVDGGSTDNSVERARAARVDQLLGGDRRRRAAENRNLGLHAARGTFVQFLDGDMVLDPDWPAAALALIRQAPDVSAVSGQLEERNRSRVYQALQLDWDTPEGPALFCGGAALFQRQVLLDSGGFPEDVQYGEEPLLCWRLRNEFHQRIYHLHRRMAWHDLAYKGFLDYWRRNVRVGETYADIAARLKHTAEPMWSREVNNTLFWGAALTVALLLLILAPVQGKLLLLILFAALLARKTIQTLSRNVPLSVAFLYAAHTYFAKLGAAWGILKRQLRSTGQ